jgi:hypothetical protein
MFLVTGIILAKSESFDEARRLSLDHVERLRKAPGCISHAVHVDCENPVRLFFISCGGFDIRFSIAASSPSDCQIQNHTRIL